MFWTYSKQTKRLVIQYLNRVFLQTPQWQNTGVDIVELPDDVGDTNKRLAIEAFAFDGEKYPVITVAIQGLRQEDTAFNNFIGELRNEYILSTYGNRYASTDGMVLQQSVGSIPNGETVRGVEFDVYQVGPLQDEVTASLGYFDGSGSIVYVASGSGLPDDKRKVWQRQAVYFNATQSIDTSARDWYISIESLGVYYLMVDTGSTKGGYSVSANRTVLGTPGVGDIALKVVGPQVYRLGGLEEVTLGFKVQAMNDVLVAEDIAELLQMYLKLGRYKGVNVDYDDSLALFNQDGVRQAVGELHAKGIYVDTVTEGPEEQRRRGENDIIHTRNIQCVVRTEWGRDIPISELEDVSYILSSQR